MEYEQKWDMSFLSLLHTIFPPTRRSNAEDPLDYCEALEDARAIRWKNLGSLSDCMEQIIFTPVNLNCTMTWARNKPLLYLALRILVVYVILVSPCQLTQRASIKVFIPTEEKRCMDNERGCRLPISLMNVIFAHYTEQLQPYCNLMEYSRERRHFKPLN